MDDYSKLQELAESAIKEREEYVAAGEPGLEWNRRLLAFQAAANPAAVLELIAEIKRLEAWRVSEGHLLKASNNRLHEVSVACATAEQERDQLRAEIAGLRTGYEAYERVNAELKAENEALRRERDARHPFKPFHEPAIGFTGCVICGVYTDHGGLPCPKTRATADAALGQGEQP